jgi:DNA-directed RNA polymerase specialized sigma24 family protein
MQKFVGNLLSDILFVDAPQIFVDLLLDRSPPAFFPPRIHFIVIPEKLVRTLPNSYVSGQVPSMNPFFEEAMPAADLAQSISRELPYLRRYARALTGSQTAGDNYAAATLEAILSDRSLLQGDDTRIGLFRIFHAIWQSSGQPVDVEAQTPREASAQAHLRGLTPNSREALLLRTIEELRYDQIAQVMQCQQTEIEELIQIALNEMSQSMSGKVMVIEDETIIAMDLKGIVQAMGHDVTGIARTHSAAIDLAHQKRPDLILADIQLANGSSGIDAVNELLAEMGDIPVIFITAFPERLLTGDRPEPAFLISKPYSEEQVRSAVSQAMFFASTEGLAVL